MVPPRARRQAVALAAPDGHRGRGVPLRSAGPRSSPSDEARQFYRLTPGKKMIVMLGGPTHEPGHLPRAHRDPAAHAGLAHDEPDDHGPVGQQVRRRRRTRPTRAATPARRPRRAARRLRPDCSPATASWRSTARRSTQLGPGRLDHRARPRGQDADAHRRPRRRGRRRRRSRPVENIKYANDTGTKTKVAGFIGIGSARAGTTTSRCRSTEVPGQIGSQIGSGPATRSAATREDRQPVAAPYSRASSAT